MKHALWSNETACNRIRAGRLVVLIGWAVVLLTAACGEDEPPETYIRQFRSMDQTVRTRAGNELIRYPADEVVPLLIEAADHELIRVRFEVMRMLGRFGDERGVPVLIRALGDPSPRVAAMAAASLTLLRAEEALPELLRYARDPSPEVRRYVIAALGPCHDSQTQPALSDSAHRQVMRALDDSRPEIRVAALESIREFGYRDAGAQLVDMAVDPSPDVRYVVVQALGELGAGGRESSYRRPPRDPIVQPSAALRDSLVTALLERLRPDEYQSIRTRTIRALGEMQAEEAVPALEELEASGTADDQREARRALVEIR